MPKAAKYALLWSAEHASYELHQQGDRDWLPVGDGNPAWLAWLETHSGFAFAGRAGRVSLLKEARKGGTGYWYAYRRQGRRTLKHYLGRSADVTIARLEATAAALKPVTQPNPRSPDNPVVPQPHPRMSSTPPLLTPKLQLPRLPAGLVARTRLFAQLEAGLERKLTLLAAPAGFGKTTLVASWLAKLRIENEELRKPPDSDNSQFNVAWVALDDGDNDPIRFWRYVISACQSFDGQLGQSALALLATTLQPPFNPLSHEMLLSPFLNDLARHTRHEI
ncbi:MAG: LuxR family transcriptional regulator, partial [Roseiflexaceae bacterium]